VVWGAEDPFAAIRENRLAALDRADVTVRDRRVNTLLIYAAAFGSVDAVRRLVERGADVNAKNSFGATALVYAAANEAKVRLLVAHGADVNARTRQGRTPLTIAAACDGCSGVVKLLPKRARMRRRGTRADRPRWNWQRRLEIERACGCCWRLGRTPAT
jgi:ankyrin repeat protein